MSGMLGVTRAFFVGVLNRRKSGVPSAEENFEITAKERPGAAENRIAKSEYSSG
jgi:hypothetical protein